MRNKLPYLFIVIGLLIMLAPKLAEWKANHEQDQLLQQAEQFADRTVSDLAVTQTSYAEVSHLLDEGDEEEATAAIEPWVEVDGKQPIGLIEIDTIALKLPILEGATKENMRHAAAHLSDTDGLGQPGNTAIAAHRARTEGRLFNRLDEVKLGDQIHITTNDDRYTYRVIKISVVEPTDISVLDSNREQKWLTLITCTPQNKSTHRLIVQAELIE